MDLLQDIKDKLLVLAEDDTTVVVTDDSQPETISPDTTTDTAVSDEPYGTKVELWAQIAVIATNWVLPSLGAIGTTVGTLVTQGIDGWSGQGEKWDHSFAPASWAFAIWAVIYPLQIVYLIYQTLPTSWVPRRNDELIYYFINIVWALNITTGFAWIPIWVQSTLWGFIVCWVMILFMLLSNLYIMYVSDWMEVWWVEVFTVRIPFSIYAGWITGATILNTITMLKSWGMSDPSTPQYPVPTDGWNFMKDLMFITEDEWAITILWVAEVIYELASWTDRNPVYGCVYLWALAGILEETVSHKPEKTDLITNISVVIGVHAVSMMVLFGYLVFENLQPWYEPLSFWKHGVFSNTNWGEMFTDINYLLKILEEHLSEAVSTREALI